MPSLEHFQAHLESLSPAEWGRLFSLLPELEETTNFGEFHGIENQSDGSLRAPYWISTEVVSRVVQVLHDLDLLPVFDWTSWEAGREILDNTDTDFSALDTITLCKLLTVIVRQNRFYDGFVIMQFKRGVVQQIITALQQRYAAME